MAAEEISDLPDFAGMYGHRNSPLSPRMAWCLWTGAVLHADTYGDGRWDLLKPALPAVVQRLVDEDWMERFVSCFEALALRLETGEFDSSRLASCTGEEMALHLVIDAAEDGVRDGSLIIDGSLPADPDRDDDFDTVRELLFRDHDVLLLFDASLDGIEDPHGELAELGVSANLHPNAWYLPFADHASPHRPV